MAEVLSPDITLIVLWTTQFQVDIHWASITDSGIDTIFCNIIMMVFANSTVFDNLNL